MYKNTSSNIPLLLATPRAWLATGAMENIRTLQRVPIVKNDNHLPSLPALFLSTLPSSSLTLLPVTLTFSHFPLSPASGVLQRLQ